MQPDPTAYLKSLADELAVNANRVRALIGDRHWLTDGHHKEALLGSLLRRFLPSSYLVTRGFVVDDRLAEKCSREQDLLVVDTASDALLFNEFGVVISFSRHVAAAISVKTKLEYASWTHALDGILGVLNSPFKRPWGGIFFFHEDTELPRVETVANWCRERLGSLEADGGELAIRASSSLFIRATADEFRLYDVPGMATSCFLACCLDALSAQTRIHASFTDLVDLQLPDNEPLTVRVDR